jgi:DNA invertase Pin-like site-specific DNA recombinase
VTPVPVNGEATSRPLVLSPFVRQRTGTPRPAAYSVWEAVLGRSDLLQSPFLSGRDAEARPGRGGPRLVAFVGRTSTDDLQDPTISLPRQLRAAWAALPEDAAIVAFFFDVETGRADPATRGHGRAHEQFDIPLHRDGGIRDLLEEAGRPDRRFDAVICESVERIARRTYYGVAVEHELERMGVPLLAADEGPGGSHATRVLTRRVKQGLAEWYVLDMLEKSRAGFAEHTMQGFNIGAAPYGYRAKRVPHPVPAKRAEGKTKTRLVPNRRTAPVVAHIFAMRVVQRLSYAAIASVLNESPARFPPPAPNGRRRCLGQWTFGSVRAVLTNPKYTGYMVWNRRATKRGGTVNAMRDWVCSPRPTHPPIISVETFTAAAAVGRWRQGSRPGAEPNRHPATRHTYPLRGFVVCSLCGHRMFGATRRQIYMMCQPKPPRPDVTGHFGTISVRYDAFMDGLRQFIADHLLGRDREARLAIAVRHDSDRSEADRRQRLAELDRRVHDLNRRRARLVASLEACAEPDPDLVQAVQVRMAELRAQRDAAEAQRRGIADRIREEPNPRLLALLPTGTLRWDLANAQLRTLFDLLRLQISYDRPSREATYRCALTASTLPAIAALLRKNITAHRHGDRADRARPSTDGTLDITGRYVLNATRAYPTAT